MQPVMDFLSEIPASRFHRADDNQLSWSTPPLDGSLALPEFYDYHIAHNPDYPVFRYLEEHDVKELRFRDVVPAAYTAARFVSKSMDIDLDAGQRPSKNIAVLTSFDTITTFTTIIGLLRADITFFVISPNHSPASICYLLTATPVTHFFVSQERRDLAEAAIQLLENSKPVLCRLPVYSELYLQENAFIPFRSDPRRKDWTVPRYLLHSSGTTSKPKSISRNDRTFLQMATVPLHGERDLLGAVFGCFGMRMHHVSAFNLVGTVVSTGLILATLPPNDVGLELGPEITHLFWESARTIKPTFLGSGGARNIEKWSTDPEKVAFLKQVKGGITFAGSPLNKTVGDALAKEGIRLHSIYGSTEIGYYCMTYQEDPGMDWEYFQPNPLCGLEFLPLGDGTFELLIVEQPTYELSVSDTTFNGKRAFKTNDIVAPHPTLPNRWKVLGRLDDLIILNDGTKAIPGPIEEIICRDPHIQSAVLFGNGKSHNGVLIELQAEHALNAESPSGLEALRDLIWPAIAAANGLAHRDARIPRELIGFTTSSKPFEYNAKGMPKRASILEAYKEEIDDMYIALQNRLIEQKKGAPSESQGTPSS